MGATRPTSRMAPVELVEDDEDAPATSRPRRARGGADGGASGDGPGARPSDDGEDRPPWRRHRTWLLAVLAVVLALAAAGNVVAGRAAAVRADRIARAPGLVRPLAGPPEVRWSAPVDGPQRVLTAGGYVLTVTGPDGRWVLRAHDVRSGDEVWRADLVDSGAPGFEAVVPVCLPGEADDEVVLCAWPEPNAVYAGDPDTVGTSMQFVALDPADGRRRGAWSLEETLLGGDRQGDGVVLVTGLPDKRVLVERRGLLDGELAWSWTSRDQLIGSVGLRPAPVLEVSGDLVVLRAHATTVFAAETGRVLRQGGGGQEIRVRALPDGGFASWTTTVGGRLHDPDGTVRGEIDALPVRVVGDTSVEGLLVDVGNVVQDVSPVDGTVRWEVATTARPVAVVDGVVVLGDDASVGAVDEEGRLLWEQRLRRGALAGPLTDGLHVLVAEPDGSVGRDLVARGLRDGVEQWRVALPREVDDLRAVRGLLVASSPDEVFVLG